MPVSQFEVAGNPRVTNGQTAHTFICDLLHARMSDGHAKTRPHQADNRKPVRRFLHHARPEASLLAQALKFFPCALADIRGEKYKRLRTLVADL